MSTAIFFSMPAYGHINPTLPVVAELVRRGDNVIYYSLEEFRVAIEHTGASFRSYEEPPPSESNKPEENITKRIYQLMYATQIALPRLLAEVQAIKPDYLIHDSFCPWGKYIAQITGVPAITSSVIFAITPALARSMPSRVIQQFFLDLAARREKRLIHAITVHLSEKYGVPKRDILDLVTNPEPLNIVYTSRYFQPFAHLLDDRFKFVGPSISPRPEAPVFPFEELAEEKPLIYIALGTTFVNTRPDFYRMCCEAFAGTEWQIVLSIGQNIAPDVLGHVPENILVRPMVPQLLLLQRTKVFITHAGMNSANEALYYGVPMIAIPHVDDQPWVAQRIKQLGAGKVLHKGKVTAKKLRRSVEEILADPAYAQASARIGKTLREAGGYQRAVDEIQSFKCTRNIAP